MSEFDQTQARLITLGPLGTMAMVYALAARNGIEDHHHLIADDEMPALNAGFRNWMLVANAAYNNDGDVLAPYPPADVEQALLSASTVRSGSTRKRVLRAACDIAIADNLPGREQHHQSMAAAAASSVDEARRFLRDPAAAHPFAAVHFFSVPAYWEDPELPAGWAKRLGLS